ncbi:MAG: glycosyltransferase [Chloroflexi bacterium]|nr:glycosyltransferase [Chloroflexota bacterium]
MTATSADDTLIHSGMDVSVVIPAYNEARRLPATLAGWHAYLGLEPFSSEVIVVDDGSRDATAEVAATGGARVVALRPNRGKGGAVKAGVLAAAGAAIAYVDADLNIAPEHLEAALTLIDEGADLVAGQRELSEYASAEGPLRLAAGGVVQVTRRVLVMSAIRDTQCGFKVLRHALARDVFSRTRINSFAFDIEVLFVARKLGARIETLPVRTTYRGESTFNVRKHLPQFLKDIVQIRRNDMAGLYRR